MYRGLLLLVVSVCSLAWSQECIRTLPINVLDVETGHQISPLAPENLRGKAAGTSLSISAPQKFTAGRILVLIDLSASMESEAEFLKHFGPALLQNKPAGSQVAFGFFNDKIVISPGFTADPKDLDALVEQARTTPVKGHTALLDAIHEGLELFKEPQPGDSLLVVTDGRDNLSKIKDNKVEQELKAGGVRFFSVLFLPPNTEPWPQEAGPAWVSSTAEETGGATYKIGPGGTFWADKKWRAKLNNALLEFWLEAVTSGYTVTLNVPREVNKSRRWKLDLVKRGDKRFKDAVVYYPQFLAPCVLATAAGH